MEEGDENNILFGAEWDGKDIEQGVNELVTKLAEVKEAEAKLRAELKEVNKEIDFNTRALAANREALAKATDQKEIQKLTTNIAVLSKNEEVLSKNLRRVNEDLIVVSKGSATYNAEINRMIKANQAVGLSLEKFTNINHLAGEAVRKVGNFAKEAAFGLISGFAGGIIATVIPNISKLVDELLKSESALTEFELKQKAIGDSIAASGSQYSKAVANVNELRISIDLAKQGFIDKDKVVKFYNETIGKTTGEVKNLDEAETELNKNAAAYIQFTLLKAAANIALGEAAQKAFEIEKNRLTRPADEATDVRRDAFKNATKEQIDEFNKLGEEFDKAFLAGNKKLADSIKAQRDAIFQGFAEGNVDKKLKDSQKALIAVGESLLKDAAELSKKFGFDFFGGKFDDKDKDKDKKAVENEFEKRMKELQARLSEVLRKSFETEGTIKKQFQDSLAKEISAINAVDKAKLTPKQKELLIEVLVKINDAQLAKSLADFNSKMLEAQKKINDALEAAQHDADIRRINNIRDEFEKQRQLIDESSDAIGATLIAKRDQLIADLDKTNLVGEAKAGKKSFIKDIFKDLLDQVEISRNLQQMDNAFKQYLAAVRDGNIIFERLNLQNDKDTAAAILSAKALYNAGAISYEEYQKRVTKALKDQKEERDRLRLLELRSDLRSFQARLAVTQDPKIRAQLEKLIRDTEESIAQIEIGQGKPDKDDPNAKRTALLRAYLSALGTVLKTIVSFWQQVNAVEAAALDRSIALQEKRVENARDIADKGNAEYLEMEQKRLDQLQARRENAARKTLAMNQALTLSEALLAAVTAISQAVKTGTVIAGIGAAVAIFGVIASAFAFAASLQPPVATFYKGTESVEQKGKPSGIDTIPARLTVGERVITAKENKDYYPALTAIHNRKVDPAVMNSFVENVLKGGGEKVKEKVVEKTIHQIRTDTEREKATDRFVREVVNSISERVTNSNLRISVMIIQKELRNQIHDREFLRIIMPQIINQVMEGAKHTSTELIKDYSSKQFSNIVSTVIKQIYEREKSSFQSDKAISESKQQSSKESKEVISKADHDSVQKREEGSVVKEGRPGEGSKPVDSEVQLPDLGAEDKTGRTPDQPRIGVQLPELKKEDHEKSTTKDTEKTVEKIKETTKEVLAVDKPIAAGTSEPSPKFIPVGIPPNIQPKETVERIIEEVSKPDQTASKDKPVKETIYEKDIPVDHPGVVYIQPKESKDTEQKIEKISERLAESRIEIHDLKFGSDLTDRERHFFYHNNKEFHSAISAIFEKSIAPEVINTFVEKEIRSQIEKDNRRYERIDRESYTFEDYRREREIEKQNQSRDLISSSTYAGREVFTSNDKHIIDQKTIEKILPATVINSFIKNYPVHNVPNINFERLARATESKAVAVDNDELEKKLDKVDRTLNKIVEAIQKTGTEINFDEEGMTIKQSKIARRLRIRQQS